MFTKIVRSVRRLFSSRDGGVAIQIGIGIVALTGMTGLGAETTYLYYKQRQMQSATDAASLSGAIALTQSGSPEIEARAVAARMGFAHGVDGVTVTVNVPPRSGSNTSISNAVEVGITQPQNMAIMGTLMMQSVSVGTRSVAKPTSEGRFCVLALDPSASQALFLNNNAVISNENCGVAVNSTSATALVLDNNAEIKGPTNVTGGWSLSNNAQLSGPHVQYAPPTADPYENVGVGDVPGCTTQTSEGSNQVTLNLTPGHFCNGWDFKNQAVLNLAPGIYYIDSKLSIKNGVVINGTSGVTLVINGNYAIDIANNAVLNLNASVDGNFAGIAIYGLRTATSSVLQKFSNNTILNLQGAVYFPNQTLEFDNNGTTLPNGCTQVIGRKVKLMNNVDLGNNCLNTGVKPLGPPAELIE